MQAHQSVRTTISRYINGDSAVEPASISQAALAVSPSRAAALLGIGRTLLYELINDGSLKTVKIASRRLITVDAIRALLTSREVLAEGGAEQISAHVKTGENPAKRRVSR